MAPVLAAHSVSRPSYLVHAPTLLRPCDDVPDEMHTSIIALGEKLGLHTARWGINLESLPLGTRSSVPHAHRDRDEFVYVVSGSGLVWLDGHTYEVGPGDCVGFPAGTGEAHSFVKAGKPDRGWEDEYEERVKGGPLVLLVIGENGRGDKVWYPRGEHEHPNKMRQRTGWWTDPPTRPQGPHSGWPAKPRGYPKPPSAARSQHEQFGPPPAPDPPPAAFWPTTGRVLHAKVMPAPCPFVPGAASAMLSAFTGLSGRYEVTQLRLPPGVSSHSYPAAAAAAASKLSGSAVSGPDSGPRSHGLANSNSTFAGVGLQAPDAAARAQGDTLVYVLEGQGELHVWNAPKTLPARADRRPVETETSAVEEGDCAVFPGGSGLAWAVRNSAEVGSKEDLDILIVEENVPGDAVVYPCARDVADARAQVEKEGRKWWDVATNGASRTM